MNLNDSSDKDKKKSQKAVIVNDKEIINRYGEAIHEYGKAYTGYTWKNEVTGQEGFAKGHKQVAQSKINPQYKEQNIKQQAGFNAEIDVVAKTNADNIINKQSRRVSRSNDVGRGNDMRYDIGDINSDGDFIIVDDGTVKNGVQLKFSGKYKTEAEILQSAKRNVNKMRPNGEWGKYKNTNIGVPSEQYEPMREYAQKQNEFFSRNAARYRKEGNYEKAAELDKKAKEYKDCYDRIKDSGISSKEAVFAREHPELYTAKRIAETANEAGIEQVKSSLVIGSTIAAARNAVDILKGKKDFSSAAKDVVVSATTSAVNNYVVTASSAALKGIMRTSKNALISSISRTNAPMMMVTGVIEVSKSFKRFLFGEINDVELVQELGEKGVGMVASSWGATIGTIVAPGVGTVIGASVAYMTSSVMYQGIIKVYNDEKISFERKKKIESFVEDAKFQMERERKSLERQINIKYRNRARVFQQGLNMIELGSFNNNFDIFLKGINKITVEINGKPEFNSFQEIDRFMRDSSRKLDF